MRLSSSKKKLSAANRRLRERSRLSFLFVLFFFGLFSLIIVMETLMADGDKSLLRDEEDVNPENDDYSSWDVSYEDQTLFDLQGNLRAGISKGFKRLSPATSSFDGNSNGLVLVEDGMMEIDSGNGQQYYYRNKTTTTSTVPTTTTQKAKSIPIQPDWQEVSGTREKFYVYSAYYNAVFDHIRIIGATKTKTQQHVQCRFYDNDTKPYITVDGSVKTIRENWNLKYSACFVICYIADKKIMPRYVSVVTSSSPASSATNIMRVQFPSEKSGRLVDFSVCVKPIHFHYDNLLPFLEWMEFHKLMGVEHFTFYNHTIGPKVACLLKEYGEQVEVLPWSLPFVSQKEIRTEGLFVALNDCVYRHRGASKYLLLVDLDEMIVPRRTANYSQLIEQLDTLSNKKKIGAYSMQNAFFYLQWPDDITQFKIQENPLAEIISRKLLMLTKTRRRARLHPHKQRSKYICDPEKVVEAGNHFVWEMATGYFTLSVPPHLGALHHYRVCEFGGDQCTKSASVIDKSSHNFGQQLAIRVANKLQQLASKCHFDINKILQLPLSSSSSSTIKSRVIL